MKKEREIAQLLGLKTYIASKPCARKHAPERYTQQGACTECVRLYGLKRRTGTKADVLIMERVHADDAGAIRKYIHKVQERRAQL